MLSDTQSGAVISSQINKKKISYRAGAGVSDYHGIAGS